MSKKTAPKAKTQKTTKKAIEQTGDAPRSQLDLEETKKLEAARAKKVGGKDNTKKAPKEKKVSAIDAAAQVLASSKEPLNCKAMIDAMTAKGLWTSPGGKTPHATLYSAIIREINEKGKEARFVKTDRGHFAAAGTAAATGKTSTKAAGKKAAKTEIAEGSPGPKSLSKLFKI